MQLPDLEQRLHRESEDLAGLRTTAWQLWVTGGPLRKAAATNVSLLRAVMAGGTGKRSRKAKNHSLRLLLRKRSASGKYSGR